MGCLLDELDCLDQVEGRENIQQGKECQLGGVSLLLYRLLNENSATTLLVDISD